MDNETQPPQLISVICGRCYRETTNFGVVKTGTLAGRVLCSACLDELNRIFKMQQVKVGPSEFKKD